MKVGTIVVWDADVGIVTAQEWDTTRWFIEWHDGTASSYYENTIYYHMEVICEGR